MLVASGLQIPKWVPDPVANKARVLHSKQAGAPIAHAVIERLASHPNMRTVWKELNKQRREKHRPTGEAVHKVTGKFFFASRAEALADLFEFAFKIGWLTITLPSARPYEPLAQRLRDEAKRLANDPFAKEIKQSLLRTAEHCAAVTASPHNPPEAIAFEIATYLDSVFGSPMYKLSAIIASVITGHKIGERRVRTLLESPYR